VQQTLPWGITLATVVILWRRGNVEETFPRQGKIVGDIISYSVRVAQKVSRRPVLPTISERESARKKVGWGSVRHYHKVGGVRRFPGIAR
jgi:hypothetical protein